MFTTTQELEAHSVNLWEMEILFGSDYEFNAFVHDMTFKNRNECYSNNKIISLILYYYLLAHKYDIFSILRKIYV